jgi:hypothetical protein
MKIHGVLADSAQTPLTLESTSDLSQSKSPAWFRDWELGDIPEATVLFTRGLQ